MRKKTNTVMLNNPSTLLFDAKNPERLYDIVSNVKPEIIISCLTGDFEKLIAVYRIIVVDDYLQENRGTLIFLSRSNVFGGTLDTPFFLEGCQCYIKCIA